MGEEKRMSKSKHNNLIFKQLLNKKKTAYSKIYIHIYIYIYIYTYIYIYIYIYI